MKLKVGQKVTYENDHYKFSGDIWRKKVTSRAFPSLIGKNKWESKGHAILERFSILRKEYIDPYYMVRGAIAEIFVYEHLMNLSDDYTLITWNAEREQYDNFHGNLKFGGLVDIAIARPLEKKAVVEVKSKGMMSYNKVVREHGNIEEVLQGKFLTELAKVNKLVMAYVFFTDDQENTIKDYISRDVVDGYEIDDTIIKRFLEKFKWTYKVVKILLFENEVDADLLEKMELP